MKNGNIIVIAVNHNGNMTGDNSGDGILRVWERPLDLTYAFNKIMVQAEFKDLLDSNKVAAAGHSAGGTTALHLAGGRFGYEKFASPMPNCAGAKDPFVVKFCDQIKKINPKSYGRKTIEADYSDSRVKAVAAFYPGQALSYNKQSLQQMGSNALVFIASDQPQSYDQIYTKEFLKLMPNSRVEIVPNSVHMSFLQPCHNNFPNDNLELRELCGSGEKEKIQSAVAEKTLRHFQAVWKAVKS